MKITAAELRSALKFVKPAKVRAEKHKVVLVERTARGLTIAADYTASDGLWLSTTIPGLGSPIRGNAAVVVELASLSRLVVGDATFDLEIDSNGLHLHTTTRYLPSKPPAQTTMTLLPLETDMLANPPVLRESLKLDLRALAEVAGAASDDRWRPVLTTVQVKPSRMVATDSYRLYVRRVRSQLPRKTMQISAVGARLMATLVKPTLHFGTFGPVSWIEATDGTNTVGVVHDVAASGYPKVDKLIPKAPGPEYIRFGAGAETVLKAFIRNAKKCAAVFEPAAEERLSLRAQHNVGEDPCTWTAELEGEMSVPKLAFNPKFLLGVFDGAESRELRGIAKGSQNLAPVNAPWTLHEKAPGGQRVRVLMPVRVR